MKPIKLEFKGINNFENEQSIDFEKLISGGLFGVFGETGSGKTTIIDAMTLALFGKISRYTKITTPDFININCDSARVYFQFQALYNGQPSIIAIERKFKKKIVKESKLKAEIQTEIKAEIQAEEIGQPNKIEENPKDEIQEIKYRIEADDRKVFLINPDNSKEMLAEKKEMDFIIKEIIGLEYDDFLKTVVLPQGKFSEFLNTEGRKRTEMLERIFRIEEYGDKLDEKLKVFKAESQMKMRDLESGLKANEDITQENLEINMTNLNIQSKNLEQLQITQKQNDKIFSELFVLKKHFDNFKLLNSDLDYQQNKQQEMNLKKSKIEKAQNALEIAEVFQKENEAIKLYNENQINLRLNQKSFEESLKQLETFKQLYETCLKEKEQNLEPLKEKGNNLLLAKEIQQEIKTKNQNLLTEYSNFLSLEQNEKDLIVKEGKSLKEKLEQLELELSKDAKIKAETQEKVRHYENLLDLEDKLKLYQDKDLIADIAKRLIEGENCPVCGSKNHPEIATGIENALIESLEKEKENLIAQIKIKFKTFNKNEKEKENLSNQISTFKSTIATLTERETNYNKSIQQLNETIDTKKKQYVSRKKYFDDFKQATGIDKLQATTIQSINTENPEQQLNTSMTNIKSLVDAIKSETAKLSKYCENPSEIDRQIKEIRNKINVLIENEKSSSENLENANAKSRILETEVIKLKQNDEIYLLNKNNSEQQSKIALEQKGFENVEDFQKSYMKKEEIEDLKLEVKTFGENLISIQAKIEELEKQLMNVDKEEIEKNFSHAKNEKVRLEEEISKANSTIGGLGAVIKNINQKLEEVKKLSNLLATQTKRNDLLLHLDSLLRGKKFVKFIARRQLNSIIRDASLWLRDMSAGRYEVAINNDAFVIVDNFNGGVKRPTSSLSGGETFIVSLSLALGLASKVQAKNGFEMEFFFLDEGFGTLDNSLLGIVMEALEKLQRSGMSVGLISHVEEIKTRVSRRIIATKQGDNSNGSYIVMET